MKQRVIAVSNIHGYYDEFVKLLKSLKYNGNSDKLVILGNVIDLGPKSFATLSLIQKMQKKYGNNIVMIKGIHEQLLQESFQTYMELGYFDETVFNMYCDFTQDNMLTLKTIDAFLSDDDKKALLEWLDSLPYYAEHKNDDDTLVFTSCAINNKKALKDQTKEELMCAINIGNNFYLNPAIDKCITIFGNFSATSIHKELSKEKKISVWFDTKYYDKICINCNYHITGVMGALIYEEDTKDMIEVYYKKGE